MTSDNNDLFVKRKRKSSAHSGKPIRLPFLFQGKPSLSCAGCFAVLPVESFGVSNRAASGRKSQCKKCTGEQ